MRSAPRLVTSLTVAAAFTAAALPSASFADTRTDFAAPNLAFNVLVPGQDGGGTTIYKPTVSAHSFDQALLYDALTPLRGNVSLADVQSGNFYKPETFGITGTVKTNVNYGAGRGNLKIVRDSFNVPHVTASKRADVAFGIGYVTAADRHLLIDFGRGPGYVSALSLPGVNAFGLITSATPFVPSAWTKAWMHKQVTDFCKSSSKARQVCTDFTNYVAGINRWYMTKGGKKANWKQKWTVDDVFAAFSFIGSIFGNGGGNEVSNSNLLAKLQAKFGETAGLQYFRDFRHSNDLDSPVSWKDGDFPYNVQPNNTTNSGVPGSVVIDADSQAKLAARTAGAASSEPRVKRYMSNALLVPGSRSATGHPLAVMGPQLGYFHPEIVMEIDVHGGGYDFRGAMAPVAPYGLIGRGADYAWSLTSASSDNSDQFLEKLCLPRGRTPNVNSRYYLYKGSCKPMVKRNAGKLAGKDTYFWETVHGPVSGTVTAAGVPYAVSNSRATRGREPYSALALADLSTGQVTDAESFFSTANKFETTFNWHYVDSSNICFFSSGRLPVRASGIDSSLPTLGTGSYDWQGFITQEQHPHGCNPVAAGGDKASDLITNWNNRPAHGWGAADDEWSYTSTHRMDLFQRLFRQRSGGATLQLNDVVGVMNQAATEDAAAVDVMPTIQRMLTDGRTNDAGGLGAAADDAITRLGISPSVKTLVLGLADWRNNHDASREDSTADGDFDHFGPAAWDITWPKIADAVVGGRLDVKALRDALWGVAGGRGDKTYQGLGVGLVHKDLATILGDTFQSPYHVGYCGQGNKASCQDSIWRALDDSVSALTDASGSSSAADWKNFSGHKASDNRIKFGPLDPGGTMRWTNRPTFQQAISFDGHR